MKRLGVTFAGSLLMAALLSGTALASNEWCDDDPVFTTLGATFSLTTTIRASALTVSSVSYVVEVPQNAQRVAVTYPAGQTLSTTVKIVRDLPRYDGEGAFPVIATVTVSGSSSAAVQLTAGGATAAASAAGTTGQPLTLSFTVSPRGDDQGDDQN